MSALLMNLSDFEKIWTNIDSFQIPDLHLDLNLSNCFVIIQSGYYTSNVSRNLTFAITLKEQPAVTCQFTFNLTGSSSLVGNVYFTGQTFAPKYEITLYYVNSKMTLSFLETLAVKNIKANTAYNFKSYPFFTNSQLQGDKCINQHLILLCEITGSTSKYINRPISEKEMPAKFISLYEDKLLTDFKIVCEKKEFFVHKNVLAYRSPVFRAMLEHEMQESKENQIVIQDFEPEIVQHMIHYIYADELKADLTQETLEKLLLIADKYNMNKLKLFCIYEIPKFLDSMTKLFEVITFIQKYNLTDFKEVMFRFIKENARTLKSI